MKRLWLGALWLMLAAGQASAQELSPYAGTATPSLQLKDLAGKMRDLKDYRGQVVMVQFWATYCPPCVKEMPSMVRLKSRFQGKPFAILAVNMGETEKEVTDFLAKVKTDFTILMDNDGNALSAWKVFVAPTTFLIDAKGKIRFTLQGGAEWDAPEYVAKIAELMSAQ